MPVETDNPPCSEDVRAGFSELTFQNKCYVASDVRHISLKRAAVQGGLPFALNENSQNRVADWRCEDLFITLDYSGETSRTFFGHMMNLDNLKLGNARSEDEIKGSVDRLRGSTTSESCPSCGSPAHWVNDLTPHLNCTSCGSELATGKDEAGLITVNTMHAAQQSLFILPAGRQDRLKNREFYVMGAARYTETSTQETFGSLFDDLNRMLTLEGQ